MRLPLAFACLLAAVSFARAASKDAPAPAPVEPVPPPKSVFTFDAKTSKDPFFPKTRRFEVLVAKQTNDVVLPPPPLFPDGIRYQGSSGTHARPLAIINNKTVERGERFDLIINGQKVRVQCVDIKDKSVVLEVNGITRELKLRAAFQ